jgi:Tfp pilus assembly protein PilO
MRLIPLNELRQIILSFLVIIVACGIFYSCYVDPLLKELDGIGQSTAVLTSKLANQEPAVVRLAKFEAAFQDAQKRLDDLLSHHPKQSFNIFQSLQQLATIHDVVVGWHAPPTQLEPVAGNIAIQQVTIQLTGKYEDLISCLNGMDKVNGNFGIASFDIQGIKGRNDQLLTHLVLQVPALKRVDDEEIAMP